MARLLRERNGTQYVKPVRIETEPDRLTGLLNPLRWKIMQALAERPRYPAELADEFGVHEQKVYYHIRQLADNNLIEISERKPRGGATAKYYRVTAHAFALDLPYGEEQIADFSVSAVTGPLQRFLEPFTAGGRFTGTIVVGSPDPHGPHQVRARDTHLAVDIGRFLGQYAEYTGAATALDVDVKAQGLPEEHLIVLGGPLTNMVTADINENLSVRFDKDHFPFRKIVSDSTGNTYTGDTTGFIARTPNPADPSKTILVIAGVRMNGTIAAVRALTEYHEQILADYEQEDKWGVIVDGKDMDGDGKIDTVERVE